MEEAMGLATYGYVCTLRYRRLRWSGTASGGPDPPWLRHTLRKQNLKEKRDRVGTQQKARIAAHATEGEPENKRECEAKM